MNRKLKLRVWDGTYLHYLKDGIELTISDKNLVLKCWDENYESLFVIDEIIEISECIGLKDKNGRDIYVDDILEDENQKLKYNVFEVSGGFAINTHQNDFNRKTPFYTATSDMQTSSYINGNCKVVGNLFENADILNFGK